MKINAVHVEALTYSALRIRSVNVSAPLLAILNEVFQACREDFSTKALAAIFLITIPGKNDRREMSSPRYHRRRPKSPVENLEALLGGEIS